MEGKPREHAVDIYHKDAELLPLNPYSSLLKDGTPCSCRLHTVALQPQWVTGKPWSLWKVFLVCLLACLIATALVVLVLYFVHFGLLSKNTTVIVHSDVNSNHVSCISGSTPSPTSWALPGIQPTPVVNQSSSTELLPPDMESNNTTPFVHEVFIDDD